MVYCTKEQVNSLFGDISDSISDDMFEVAINNSTSWIDSFLIKNHIPLPVVDVINDNIDGVPYILNTASIYFSASDILMSLYQGDEYQQLMDYWYNKAVALLESYIESSKVENNIDSNVNHRNAPTYKESVQYGHRNRCYY